MAVTGKNIVVFIAHPDDEVMSSGTLAKLARDGNTIYLVCATSGNRGTHDLNMTAEQIAAIRKPEMEGSAAAIGIKEIIWLGYDDGDLDRHVFELKEQVYRLIRTYKPEVVFSFDPYRPYEPHPDHRTISMVTLEACYLADGHLYFPQHAQAGLMPHWTPEFYMFASGDPNYSVDVRDFMDVKMKCASVYNSQFGENADPEKWLARMKERLKRMGRPEEDMYKEYFHRFRGGDVMI